MNVIVELVKSVWPLDQVPTNLVVLVLSQVLTNLSCYIYLDYAKIVIVWYFIPIIIAIGFIVAYAAMFGWEKFIKIFETSKYPKKK